MESEKEIIISFLFKRSGKASLKFSDLYLSLSMDLNWFTPDDAKAFINLALKKNLLNKEGDLLKPNFDYEKTVVPVGFSPSKKVFESKEANIKDEKDETVLEKLIKILIEKTDVDRAGITNSINSMVKEKCITEEVAAFLIGKQYSINFDDFYKIIEEKIFENN